jgi:hypothetical protein
MARIKKLKEQNTLFGLSIIDLLTEIDPTKTNKFVPVAINIIKSNLKRQSENVKYEKDYYISYILETNKNVTKSQLTDLTDLDIMMEYFKGRMIREFLGSSDLNSLIEFIDHFERGLLSCDLGKIKDIFQIENMVSLSKVKDFEKENSKTIKIEYRDDEWLLLRPLTYQSSLKYGAGTRWCTASKDNPEHFFRYGERGILVYCINLKTGEKFGYFKEVRLDDYSVNNDLELSFWNAADNRIDSIQCNFPETVYLALRNLDNLTNKSFVEETWETNKKYQYDMFMKISESEIESPDLLMEYPEPVMETNVLRAVNRNYEHGGPAVG